MVRLFGHIMILKNKPVFIFMSVMMFGNDIK